jgi:hypothetical protein
LLRGIYIRIVVPGGSDKQTAVVVTRGNKKMMAGAPVAPEALTTKRQGAKSRDGRMQEPFGKSILLRTK